MTPSFIIDCSLAMAWCFGDEATKKTAEIQDRFVEEAALVPAHWFLEVTNVLAQAEKRRRISALAAAQFLKLLTMLEVHVDHEFAARAFDHLLPFCRAHGLTSYDAAYLDLALRMQLPLATLDDDLRHAAATLGVTLLGK